MPAGQLRAAGDDRRLVKADLRVQVPLGDNGLELVLLNTPPGGRDGDFGLAAQAGREPEFRAALDQALDYVTSLGARLVHVMAGDVPAEARPAARGVYLENLAWAAERAEESGVTLLIEPINARDRPDYFLQRSDEAVALLETLRKPNVKLLFDFYHVQVMEGDLAMRLQRHWPHVGHLQFASVPGRAEPDAGEIAYPFLFALVDRLEWPGWLSAEYRPREGTPQGLAWGRPYGIGVRDGT